MNIDNYTAHKNVERFKAGSQLDLCYLDSLSIDAAPALVELYEITEMEKQVEKNTVEGVSIEDVLQQSQQNFRQKFNMSAEIIIPADFSLHAGDLVYCEFPELSTKKTLRKTPKDSGIYMISDLCHYGDKSQTYTGLRLVRDSFGVKVT